MPANTTIEIKDGTISISSNAFINCSGLTSVGIPNSVTYIGEAAFEGCGGLTSLAIPNKVTSISNYVFRRCSGLTSVTLPNSLTSIGEQAFYGCSGLTSLTIPHSVTSIGELAFYGCNGLTSLTIPDGVTSIGENAFLGCSGLTSVTIPNSVTSIDDGAFENCGALTSLFSKIEKPFRFSTNAFRNISSSCTLTVPDGTKDAYIAAGWTEDVFMGGIVEAPYNPTSANTLALTDATVIVGKQVVLPVNMTNEDAITAMQFDLVLPEGVAVAKNTKGKYIVEKTERCEEHTLSTSKPDENVNTYKVLLYSNDVEEITGNSGAVLNITLEAADNLAEGDYTVTLSNINLTMPNETKLTPANATCTLTVRNSVPGDANGDGTIDVTDIVGIANSILGHASESFDAVAADVNGDGSVDVTDIVVVANIILHDGGANAANVRGTMMQVLDPQ